MLNIFSNANTIELGHELSIASAQALSGRRQSQRRGPYLYTFSIQMNSMYNNSTEFKGISKDLREINYGVDTALVSIPFGVIPDVSGKFGGSLVVSGSDQLGKIIEMNGGAFSQTGAILDGDFVQFTNSSKVFQASGDHDTNAVGEIVAAGTTNKGLRLNTPVVESPISGTSLTIGSNVKFKLFLEDYSDPVLSPGPGDELIAQWGTFILVEAI